MKPSALTRTVLSVRPLCAGRPVSASAVAMLLLGALSGCGIGTVVSPTSGTQSAQASISGSVHGGQQPISGATIQLYAMSIAADGGPAQPLIGQTVLTDIKGHFNITGGYTCPTASTPVYLAGIGGNPGGSANNNAIVMMASLGQCGNLSASTYIDMNEVTTVGSVAALFPFVGSYSAIGAQPSDSALLASYVSNVNMYTDIGTGKAPGAALPSGYYASSMEIYSLANSIAACVNSGGGVAGDGSICGSLFSYATPSGGSAPTDTATAVANILKNPTQNATAIFNLAGPASPFQPTLAAAPSTWALPILPSGNPTITVSVSGASTANVGTAQQYTSSVTGTSNQQVTWQVNGVSGGNSTYGTISPSGLYTPPASVPVANSLNITASSFASKTAAGAEGLALYNAVPVIATANGSTTTYGQTFLVDVQGTSFINGAMLLINGSPVATTAVTQSHLQASVTNSTGAAMSITVAVANPAPGPTQSTSSGVTLSLPPASATAAARMLDQMTFGPTASTISHVQSIGLLAAIGEQFNQPTTTLTVPAVTTECVANSTWHCTQSDWLKTVVTAPDQLRQRVSLLLTELWVAPNQNDGAMPYYLNTAASDAFTNYRTVMYDMSLAPTMGAYLNMVNSGAVTGSLIPNENFGRELQQLFTLGLNLLNADGTSQLDSSNNAIPTYTEVQVQQFAKAFTGWTYAKPDCTASSAFTGTANWTCAMTAVDARHDKTAKTLLSGTSLPANQTTLQDFNGALDNIFAHGNIAPFICTQLIQHLVTGNPSSAYVGRVSAVFANNGNNVRGDMKAVLTAILLDPEARANDSQTGDQLDQSPAVQGGHLREPLLFVPNLIRGLNGVQTAAATEMYPYYNLAASGLGSVGQAPFNQASVFNYYSPSYVIPSSTLNAPEFQLENTGSVIPRLNLADQLIHSNSTWGVTVDLSSTSQLGSLASNPATLVDTIGNIFMHGQMPTNVRTSIINEVTSIPSTATISVNTGNGTITVLTRAAVAAYLVIGSSQYKIMH